MRRGKPPRRRRGVAVRAARTGSRGASPGDGAHRGVRRRSASSRTPPSAASGGAARARPRSLRGCSPRPRESQRSAPWCGLASRGEGTATAGGRGGGRSPGWRQTSRVRARGALGNESDARILRLLEGACNRKVLDAPSVPGPWSLEPATESSSGARGPVRQREARWPFVAVVSRAIDGRCASRGRLARATGPRPRRPPRTRRARRPQRTRIDSAPRSTAIERGGVCRHAGDARGTHASRVHALGRPRKSRESPTYESAEGRP